MTGPQADEGPPSEETVQAASTESQSDPSTKGGPPRSPAERAPMEGRLFGRVLHRSRSWQWRLPLQGRSTSRRPTNRCWTMSSSRRRFSRPGSSPSRSPGSR